MTLNGVMAFTLRYFNEFSEPAFQLITASSSIELLDLVCFCFILHSCTVGLFLWD